MRKIFILSIGIICTLAVCAQQPVYTAGHNSWNSDSLGNHRVMVSFQGKGNVARVRINWRRHDSNPSAKRIIVQDAKTGRRIMNVQVVSINNEYGEIDFDPVSGPGDYYIYYLLSKNEGRSNYPKGVYLKPDTTASPSWLSAVRTSMLPNTVTREFQAIDSLNSFYPMEIIATAKETIAMITRSGRKDFMLFAEDRQHPIKMTEFLPYRWVGQSMSGKITGAASKGEYFTYQLGLYAIRDLENVHLAFSSLKNEQGDTISAVQSTCLNLSGTDYRGIAFSKTISLPAKKVQALWCGVDIPQNTTAGIYRGRVTVSSGESAPVIFPVQLTVKNETTSDGGINQPQNQTRLKWLNSTLYQENEVIKPYLPLVVEDNILSMLGRKMELNRDGFPKQIQTFFTREMTGYKAEPDNLLSAPINFSFVQPGAGQEMRWNMQGVHFIKQTPGTIQWTAVNVNDTLRMEVNASLEFDGFISYSVKVSALQNVSLKNSSLQIPLKREFAKYLMGLGQKGGERPADFKWKWAVASKNQDGAWLGNVNGGLQYSLRDQNYVRPLNTNFYLQKPLLLPVSWGNENKGGIRIADTGNAVLVDNYSGERTLKAGDTLYYNFTLLITPFHTLNTDFQWQSRFYHKYDSIDKIKATGATIINIHHATPINPWINYPFIEYKKMKSYIDEAHSKGLKVKIYNTVREVSNHAYETFALRSLGHEIYSPGTGGGFSWLQEHLGNDYIAAWFVPGINDAAIVNSGMSRWHNYYVEGMNWLVQQVGIDGIYLDDVAFDRITMKRIKRALTQSGHPGIIDLHSANQYNKNDGFNNSANLYMEHFPYLNRLWFGEYFDYNNNPPDFFLTEVSGIPFGLMGEMLQDGGNAWRGMIYGMTNRMPWSDDADPRPIWKTWDDFGMQGSEMIGYWSDHCPVKTNNAKVLATVYKKNKAALISIASWGDDKAMVQLDIDWAALGINPGRAIINAPEIKNFQSSGTFLASDIIPVEKGKGWILTITER